MKLRKHHARTAHDIEHGRSAFWKTPDGRFFIYSKDPPYRDHHCWVIGGGESPWDEAAIDAVLRQTGLWDVEFPTRSAAVEALELALAGAGL